MLKLILPLMISLLIMSCENKVTDSNSHPDITSTTDALIVPSMTTVQRDALPKVNGSIIYNTTDNVFNYYENGTWRKSNWDE